MYKQNSVVHKAMNEARGDMHDHSAFWMVPPSVTNLGYVAHAGLFQRIAPARVAAAARRVHTQVATDTSQRLQEISFSQSATPGGQEACHRLLEQHRAARAKFRAAWHSEAWSVCFCTQLPVSCGSAEVQESAGCARARTHDSNQSCVLAGHCQSHYKPLTEYPYSLQPAVKWFAGQAGGMCCWYVQRRLGKYQHWICSIPFMKSIQSHGVQSLHNVLMLSVVQLWTLSSTDP